MWAGTHSWEETEPRSAGHPAQCSCNVLTIPGCSLLSEKPRELYLPPPPLPPGTGVPNTCGRMGSSG